MSVGLWVQAELMAMATDIAEFLGAAVGLNLLFGVPLLTAGLITGVIAFGILELQGRGYRRFELAITALLGLVFAGFLYETLRIGPSVHQSLGGLVPGLDGASSLYLAVGIVGATVMPHAIYLHSALTNGRDAGRATTPSAGKVLRFERLDVIIALGLAGVINLAMLAVAAKLLHTPGLSGTSTIAGRAPRSSARLVGGGAALAFAVALLASGLSSSSVGTYAGQVVMAGFINVRIPLLVRRAVTMVPALVVLAIGVNPTAALVLSQVVLSFGIPFALVPLVTLTSRRDVMGVHVNRRLTSCGGVRRRRRDHADERVPDLPAASLMALADTFQRDRRLAPGRLDRSGARSADLRRAPLRRRGRAARHLQRPALLQARLALAAAGRPPVRPRGLGAGRPRGAEAARRGRDRRRDGGPRGPHGTRRGQSDVGADRVRARRVQADPRPVAGAAAPRATMARVVAFIPDLLFGSNVLGALQAAGHEPVLVADVTGCSASCRARRC